MALIVENGSGLANAESYASVAFADTYHAGIGNAAWVSLDTTAKEQFLRQATNFMVQRFRARWNGWRAYNAQRLDWPRLGVFLDDTAAFPSGGHLSSFASMVDSASVPPQVAEAAAELAYIASVSGPLTPPLLKQGKLQTKVGPIFVAYDPRSPQTARYPVVAQILAPFLKSSSGSMKLER